MTADTVEDLKQFITALFVQESSETREAINKLENRVDKLETRLDAKIDNLDIRLSTKIDNLSGYIAEAIDLANETVDRQLKNHEHRITRLERKHSE